MIANTLIETWSQEFQILIDADTDFFEIGTQ